MIKQNVSIKTLQDGTKCRRGVLIKRLDSPARDAVAATLSSMILHAISVAVACGIDLTDHLPAAFNKQSKALGDKVFITVGDYVDYRD